MFFSRNTALSFQTSVLHLGPSGQRGHWEGEPPRPGAPHPCTPGPPQCCCCLAGLPGSGPLWAPQGRDLSRLPLPQPDTYPAETGSRWEGAESQPLPPEMPAAHETGIYRGTGDDPVSIQRALRQLPWSRHTACGNLALQPGSTPRAPAVKAPSPNRWAAREFPVDRLDRWLALGFHTDREDGLEIAYERGLTVGRAGGPPLQQALDPCPPRSLPPPGSPGRVWREEMQPALTALWTREGPRPWRLPRAQSCTPLSGHKGAALSQLPTRCQGCTGHGQRATPQPTTGPWIPSQESNGQRPEVANKGPLR